MLTRQSWIALGVALLLGVVAVYVANTYLTAKQNQSALDGTTKVAVAAVPMDFGNVITPDKVRFVDYPNRSLPPGAFQNAAQLLPAGQQRFALMPIGAPSRPPLRPIVVLICTTSGPSPWQVV